MDEKPDEVHSILEWLKDMEGRDARGGDGHRPVSSPYTDPEKFRWRLGHVWDVASDTGGSMKTRDIGVVPSFDDARRLVNSGTFPEFSVIVARYDDDLERLELNMDVLSMTNGEGSAIAIGESWETDRLKTIGFKRSTVSMPVMVGDVYCIEGVNYGGTPLKFRIEEIVPETMEGLEEDARRFGEDELGHVFAAYVRKFGGLHANVWLIRCLFLISG